MTERETYPSERALADAREEQLELRTHVAYPGRVQRYDAAPQTADVVPLIRQQVPQPDGSYALEALPVLPCVPVLFPRAGPWFLAFPVAPGDTGLILCLTSSIGPWRSGNGDVADPGDLRRAHLTNAVFLPVGLVPRSQALTHAPASGGALTLGSDTGTRVTLDADGALEITQGSTVRLRLDPDGTVHLGSDAGEFIALANLVNDRLAKLQAAFDAHVHATAALGPPSPPTPVPGSIPVGPLASVAATKAKAT